MNVENEQIISIKGHFEYVKEMTYYEDQISYLRKALRCLLYIISSHVVLMKVYYV